MRFLLPFLTEVHFPLISDRNKNPQRNDVPERLEISHARNEKDHSLDAPYVENFSHTEYQSEATVYAYLKQVSDFLKRYQELDAEYALLPPQRQSVRRPESIRLPLSAEVQERRL